MNLRLTGLLIVLPIFLMGCASQKDRTVQNDEEQLMEDHCPTCYNSWIGSPINSLSAETGKPLDNGYGSHHYYEQLNDLEQAVAQKKITFEEGTGVVRQLNGSRYPLWQRSWEDHQPESMKGGSGWNGP